MTLAQRIWRELTISPAGLSVADLGARIYGRAGPVTVDATIRTQIRRLRVRGRPIATVLRSGQPAVYLAELTHSIVSGRAS